jgi:hypothetical protein
MDYIYADFNGITSLLEDDDFECLDLTGYGTLQSLNSLQIKLKEGMEFIFYDPGEVEVVAEVFFDRTTESQITTKGRWLARFKKGTIKDCKKLDQFETHPCFNCREDFVPYLKKVGRRYKEICPKCGTSIVYPLTEP